MSDPSEPLVLYATATPPMTEGDYELTVTVDVTVPTPPPKTGDPALSTSTVVSYSRSQAVQVAGPAGGLTTSDVVQVDPPAGSTGDYAGVVPSIALARQTMPWEVAVDGQPEGMPWLALLLLRRDAVTGSGTSPTGTTVRPLDGYLAPPSGYLVPTPSSAVLALWKAAVPPPQVATIDVAVATALAALPAVADLPLLCHVRDASGATGNGAASDATPVSSAVLSELAVPPGPTGPMVAHLVSLDGFLPALWSTDADTVRLVSLSSWTFVSGGAPADFAHVMEHLHSAAFGVDADGRTTLPSVLPASPHLTPTADTATYSGPLRAPTTAAPPQCDVGADAAFQLGRLLLLNNRTVYGAVLDWLAAAVTSSQVSLERSALSAALELDPVSARHTGARRAALAALAAVADLGAQDLTARIRASSPPTPRLRTTHPRPPRHVAQRAALAARAEAAVGPTPTSPPPQQLLDWVTSVRRLGPVPWSWIVPDPSLLPDEHIAFFLIDPAWTAKVVDGALSILTTTGPSGPPVSDSLVARLAAELASSIPADLPARSGFVLRSRAVTDWPNLGVLAWADTGRTTPLTTTVTRRAPTVMLAAVDGLAQRIDLVLGPTGHSFGLATADGGVSAFAHARSLTTSSRLAAALAGALAPQNRQSFAVGVTG